jgi:hypothetical protein
LFFSMFSVPSVAINKKSLLNSGPEGFMIT